MGLPPSLQNAQESTAPARSEPTVAPPSAAIDLTKNVTFVVTEECNLRCRYCYLVHKNPDHRMPVEVAKRAVNYLLGRRDLFPNPGAVWDFIGGEPFLEIELIEQIVGHVLLLAYELEHPWFYNSRFSITTNGVLYATPPVQRFIERYHDLLDVTITVDGPEHVHDRSRVGPDGRGSYREVVRNVPLWLQQFPAASTKVTISHDNLAFVAESVLHLFSLGIRQVNANVVFENVWQPGDDTVLEAELDQLANQMVQRGWHRTHACSLFQREIGTPLDPRLDDINWCGCGRMLAIDAQGNFYPCIRFLAFALSKREARTVGNLENGIDLNRTRPFLALTRSAQSTTECLHCSVARGCAWCQALNYDAADTDTIYQRATFLCAMHKARVRANARFWTKVDSLDSQDTPCKA